MTGIRIVAIITCLLALSGCLAASQQQLTLERDLTEMKRRLAETERGLAALRLERNTEVQERLDALQHRTAEQQAALDAFRLEIQSFYGRLEDFTRTRNQLVGDMEMLQNEFGIKLAAIEDRLARLEVAPAVQPAAPGNDRPVAAEKISADADPEKVYRAALKLLREDGEYAAARQQLTAFAERFSDHPLRVNAIYWIGEALFAEQRFDQAIVQFQKVIEGHPEHPKAPAALLMQGTAFHQLNDTESAKVILRQLLSRYPDAPEAAKAEARLEEWRER